MEQGTAGETEVLAGDAAGQADQVSGVAGREEAHQERPAPSAEHELRAEVRRLTVENERYREHAERTSKLFLAATDYAQWIKESARHDAERALRKARARVARLELTADELERKESERAQLEAELERLRAATDQTRARLSAFLEAGLEALNTPGPSEPRSPDGEPGVTDLQDALQSKLNETSVRSLGSPSGLTDHVAQS